ncbi:MAG: peptidoglycan-binding domain-containing protein [Rhodospirillales bacterium]
MPLPLLWLPGVLKDAGLKVAEQPGWKTRGRPSRFGPIEGVICHHTAGGLSGNMPSLRVVTEGRAGLSGPLSQLCLGRDGTYYVVAAGKANHAGRGTWKGITSGNTHFIGIEAENTGLKPPHARGDRWPEVQMEAYRRGVAAILGHIGADADMCCGHKEYATPAGRKPDPAFDDGYEMDDFRRDVRALMTGEAPPPKLIPPVDTRDRPTIRRGSEGAFVEAFQRAIGVVADGQFGPKTEAAARSFQRSHGLVPDGIVGPATWKAVDSLG